VNLAENNETQQSIREPKDRSTIRFDEDRDPLPIERQEPWYNRVEPRPAAYRETGTLVCEDATNGDGNPLDKSGMNATRIILISSKSS